MTDSDPADHAALHAAEDDDTIPGGHVKMWSVPSIANAAAPTMAELNGAPVAYRAPHSAVRRVFHALWVTAGVLATVVGVIVQMLAVVVATVALFDHEWPKATAYLVLGIFAYLSTRPGR